MPGGAGRKTAQAWLSGWLKRYGGGRGPGWTPDLTGRRQMRWITHALFLMNGQTPEGSPAVSFAALARRAAVLQARWRHTRRGLPRFEALAGLAYSACALTGMETGLKPALTALAQGMRAAESTPAVAFVTRNPEELLEVFQTCSPGLAAILKGYPASRAIPRSTPRSCASPPRCAACAMPMARLVRMHGGGKAARGGWTRRLPVQRAAFAVQGAGDGLNARLGGGACR